MGIAPAEFLVATAQGSLEFTLQPAQAAEFAADFGKLFTQTVLDRSARLEAAVLEFEKAANLRQGKTEALDAPNEGQSFEMTFVVAAEAAGGSPRKRQEAGPFVEANRVNAEAKSFRDGANVHGKYPQGERYTLEYSPESRGKDALRGESRSFADKTRSSGDLFHAANH
ncbi:MAG TPA: hypothetical protein VKT29_13550 [Terriglobales bacterium]|nr:hypothetical protein [Terriglobales bacterium]